MSTETIQAPAPATPAAAGRAGIGRAGLPPPRRGQIKGKILKDAVAAIAAMAAALAKNNRRGGEEGLPTSPDDADDK